MSNNHHSPNPFLRPGRAGAGWGFRAGKSLKNSYPRGTQIPVGKAAHSPPRGRTCREGGVQDSRLGHRKVEELGAGGGGNIQVQAWA